MHQPRRAASPGPSPDTRTLRRIEVSAPAKVNLFLGVHPREQGADPASRHLTDNVMHTVSLADTLVLSLLAGGDGEPGTVECVCVPDAGVPQEDNLAYRAVFALARCLGRSSLLDEQDARVRVELVKRTPAQAGLGGGSSDAAAVLVAMARVYGVDPLAPEILAAARELGADVAFFLYGGAARMEGAGEVLAERYEPLTGPLVIVKPQEGVSTAAAYRAFDADPAPLDSFSPLKQAFLIDSAPAKEKTRLAHAALAMRNNLAPAAETLLPELSRVRAWLEARPEVLAAQLSGSGSATFAVCGDKRGAAGLAQAAQQEGWYALPAWFSPAGVSVVEDRRAV